MGSIEHPINPVSFAISSEATFVARAIATDAPHLRNILLRTARHNGSAFVEILQNCNVFNDGAFDSFAASAVRSERCIYIEHGKPLIFGAKGDRAISLRAGHPDIVAVADYPQDKLLKFREDSPHPGIAYMLSHLDDQKFPVPLGVFRCVEKELYAEALTGQIDLAVSTRGRGDFFQYIRSGDTWEVTS
jgi:2-oxoglutarate ferredoxin oxidoreductase subunit beta